MLQPMQKPNSHSQRGGLEFHPNLTSGHKTQTIRGLLSIRVSKKKKICLGTSLQSACQHESHFQAKPRIPHGGKGPCVRKILKRPTKAHILDGCWPEVPGTSLLRSWAVGQQRLIERRSTSGSQHQLNVTQTRTLLLVGSPLP